jgi:ABC-type transport system substrate-binding protein
MRLRARSSRAVAAMAVALSVALMAAACGEVKQGAPGATIQPINPYGGNFSAEGEPKRGGTLLVGEDREIIGFDPTVQNQNPAAAAIYDSLLKAKPDGTGAVPGQVHGHRGRRPDLDDGPAP